MHGTSIPLEFEKGLRSWPGTYDPPSLWYDAEAQDFKQPRYHGRVCLAPRIDLNAYRCEAVIDWLEIGLRTQQFRQPVNMHGAVQRILKEMGSTSTVYVRALPPRVNKPVRSKTFVIKIQEPEPWEIAGLASRLATKLGADEGVRPELDVTGVEVSVDFYVKDTDKMEPSRHDLLRWQMVEVLRRHLRVDAVLTEADNCYPRSFWETPGKKSARYIVDRKLAHPSKPIMRELRRLKLPTKHGVALHREAHHQAPVDWTYYVGRQKGPILIRVMDKTTDSRNNTSGTLKNLAPEQCRARIEVALTRAEADTYGGAGAVGILKVGDLYKMRFHDLRNPFFDFYLPTMTPVWSAPDVGFRLRLTEEQVFARSGVYGFDRYHRALSAVLEERHRRGEINSRPIRLGEKGYLVAYEELNQMTFRALRALSKKWDLSRYGIRLVSGGSTGSGRPSVSVGSTRASMPPCLALDAAS